MMAGQEALTEAAEFVDCPSWKISQAYVLSHPELLSAEGISAFDEMRRRVKNRDLDDALRAHKILLLRCHEIGVAAAFAERKADEKNLRSVVNELLEAMPRGRARYVLKQNPLLLEETTLQQLLGNLAACAKGDREWEAKYDACDILLGFSRAEGVDAACDALDAETDQARQYLTSQLGIGMDVVDAVWEFEQANTLEASRDVLREHRGLLCDAVIDYFRGCAHNPNNSEAETISSERKLALLERCRDGGFEAAFERNGTTA
jgi:hypothetical protein